VSDLADRRIGAARRSAGRADEAIHDRAIEALLGTGVSGVVLDFGAGTGSVAERLAQEERFTRVVAVDLVDYGHAAPGVEWVRADLNDPLSLDEDSIDAVVAIEVIEHLENPRFVAREWHRVLRPGGVVVLTTPNNETWRSILALIAEGHFAAFRGASYPAHLTALLSEDLRRILLEAGFAEPRFFFSDWGSLPRLTHLSWQSVSAGLLRGRRYSDNVGCVARKPTPAES
jgi:2-polyprenyl-3-methyl-5-hydroxy-6-metoxy-1,4-benzoquinol methylase